MWSISKADGRMESFLQLKGINEVISKSIKNIRNSDTVISSLNLLLLLSSENPDLLSNPDEAVALVDNIQDVSVSKVTLGAVFINQLFALLSILGKDKNQLAPSIYKVLISKFQATINDTHSRLYIQNFRDIVEEFPTIPFQPILETINSRI